MSSKLIAAGIDDQAPYELDVEVDPLNQFLISPNGKYIAYVKGARLYLTSVDDRNVLLLSQLQHDVSDVFYFVWSPYSQNIAYIGDAGLADQDELCVVSVDGVMHKKLPQVYLLAVTRRS